MNFDRGNELKRMHIIYGFVAIICLIFVARLFYLQVIRYSYYQGQANASQLKQYSITADRGLIFAYDGNDRVPVVLNERRYNIVADPQVMTDREETAKVLSTVINVPYDQINTQLKNDKSRYEIIAKKQPKDIKEKINELVQTGEIDGVFIEATNQRVYPQSNLAASITGFVNDDAEGKYGIEQAENQLLSGTDGRVKALTDQHGIPLLAEGDNILIDPVDGEDITLSIDVAMQKQLEKILKSGLEEVQSKSGDIVIMNPNNGQIKALATYPTYDPAKFADVEDVSIFSNSAVSEPLEPGSTMKVLTAAAALDAGAVSANQSYYDPSFYKIDGATVKNIEEDGGAGQRTVTDILRYSLNTGATWLLMQMGGGELNERGRLVWHDYMVNHFKFGMKTGIEQGYEEPGVIPDPSDGYGLNIKYANTTFGQGMTVTPLQMAAALSAVVNGGTYYQPTYISGVTNSQGEFKNKEPVVVDSKTVSSETSKTIVSMMQEVVAGNSYSRPWAREGYIVGGKTGSAEVANPEGGYYDDRQNGTYVGFVGGNSPEYVIMVRVTEPKNGGYAGSRAAAPLFGSAVNMLIDNFAVQSSSN